MTPPEAEGEDAVCILSLQLDAGECERLAGHPLGLRYSLELGCSRSRETSEPWRNPNSHESGYENDVANRRSWLREKPEELGRTEFSRRLSEPGSGI